MTLLKVKVNGQTDIIFVENYDDFLKEVETNNDIRECKILFVGTFCLEPELNDDVYTVIKGGDIERSVDVPSLADIEEKLCGDVE